VNIFLLRIFSLGSNLRILPKDIPKEKVPTMGILFFLRIPLGPAPKDLA
jgi:hypothetical protein